MEVIDDEGNLFGVVNVVDALVVLGVLAVVAAGVAFINPFANPDEATRYATIELEDRSTAVAEQVSQGDVMSPSGTSRNLTVTDVYRSPGPGQNVSVTVRVRINGTLVDTQQQIGTVFQYAGTTLTPGIQFTLSTNEYQATGLITNLSDTTPTLTTDQTQVRFETTVSTETADAIEPGDTYRTAGTSVATIESVHVAPGNNQDTSRVIVGATLQTINEPDAVFAGQPVTLGRSLTFQNGAYQLTGQITSIGNATIQTTTTDVQFASTVSTATAEAIEPGDTYRTAGTSVATIESVHVAPGNNQDTSRVIVGATLQTINEPDAVFAGQPVTLGRSLTFQNGVYQLTGQITSIGSTTIQTERTSVVAETTVTENTAEAITPGDTYRLANSEIATIESVTTYPTQTTNQKRVILGLTLDTTLRNGNQQFGSTGVTVGNTIPFRTSAYQFSASIQAEGTTTPPGTTDTRTIVVQLETVPPELAANLEAGLREQRRGMTTAYVRNVRVEPAVISLTSESGDIYRRQHPINKDVYLTVDVTARETDTGLRFHGRALQENRGIVLDFRTITINGQVIDITPATTAN
jgi:hypothetical protein